MLTCRGCGSLLVPYDDKFVCATYLANPGVHANLTREPAGREKDRRVRATSVRHIKRHSVRGVKPDYTMTLRIDAHVEPTPWMRRRWAFVDAVAIRLYRRGWERLKGWQKTKVMESINGGDSAPLSMQEVEHIAELLRMGLTPVQAARDTEKVLAGTREIKG